MSGVSIRRAAPDDVDFLVELLADDDVRPFLGPVSGFDRDSLLAEIELRADAAACEQEQSCPLGQDTERLDQVVDERRLVVVVGVHQADTGVEAAEQAAAFHQRVEDSVGVV